MGMAVSSGRADESMADINVTPFVDVCLVLLIIFMIVTPIILKGFDVNVPPKASEEEMEKYASQLSQQLIVTLTADGRVMLNQEEIQEPHDIYLKQRIEEVFELRGGKRLIFFNAMCIASSEFRPTSSMLGRMFYPFLFLSFFSFYSFYRLFCFYRFIRFFDNDWSLG